MLHESRNPIVQTMLPAEGSALPAAAMSVGATSGRAVLLVPRFYQCLPWADSLCETARKGV